MLKNTSLPLSLRILMGCVPDLLARAVRGGGTPSSSSPGDGLDVAGSALRTWTLPAGPHPAFADGVYTAPRDALYAVYVRVTPSSSDGDAKAIGVAGPTSKKRKRTPLVARTHVQYVLRVAEGSGGGGGGRADGSDEMEEAISVELMDVGAASFGEVLHLRKDARLTVLAMMPGALGEVELKVELVMRKRKPVASADDLEEQGLSARELKKRAKKKRRMERKQIEQSGAGEESGKGGKDAKGVRSDAVDDVEQKDAAGIGDEAALEAEEGKISSDGDEGEEASDEDWEGGFSSDGSN